MKKIVVLIIVSLVIGCLGIFLGRTVIYPNNLRLSDVPPQCAHWAIFRTTQLLGIPTDIDEIQRLLPNNSRGHSMTQVVEVLGKKGVKARGYRDDWDSLSKQTFPSIVHLANPDHYVVVSGMEHERGYIHIFDGAGNRTRQQRKNFEQRWTGYSLHVQKDIHFFDGKANDPNPYAIFDYLILDKGDIPATGEPIEFIFPIRNVGKSELVVEDVKVSCGCLGSEKPGSPIPPGESGVIKLVYSVEPKYGVFTQTAVVRTNDPNNPIIVFSVCGFNGIEVRIVPSRITLDQLFVGRETIYHCFVRYSGEWNDFHIDVESADLVGAKLSHHKCLPFGKADFSKMLIREKSDGKLTESAVKNSCVLELAFEPTGNILDKVSGLITLKTNVPGYESSVLHVSGIVTSPVQAFPSTIDFRKEKESLITLVSLIDKSFTVIGIDCDPAISWQVDNTAQKEQQLQLKKNGILESKLLLLRYRLDHEQPIIDLPLTILDNDF